MLIQSALFALLLIPAGCKTVPVTPPAPPLPPPPSRPAFQATFGEVSLDRRAFAFKYKDMQLLVDPTPEMLVAQGATADFILYTRAEGIAGPFRAGQKAIGTDDAAAKAKSAGLSVFKALSTGQRLMLNKGKGFAFVSAVKSRGAAGETVNGYLLEFDNGRNLLVLPGVADLAPVREFVYGLRDDAKTVYIALFPRFSDAAAASEIAGLIQPQIAVFPDAGSLDRSQMPDALSVQMFSGEWYLPAPRETIAF